jgi:Zn finger protein HypA/HybF involved in hydrogenase expression
MAALEIAAGLGSLKTALDIAKALWAISDAAERNSKILDLQRAIGDAQLSAINARAAHDDQVQQIRALEKEIARLKAWDGEKERYQLRQVGSGAFVYALKGTMANGEPAHWLCANCYQKREKGVLQRSPASDNFRQIFTCPVCKNHVTPNRSAPDWA